MDVKQEKIQSDDYKSEPKVPRLGTCEVCNFCSAKYTCPRCEVKTCSLKCNKIHKLELECSGARDKTKFIPLRKMTNLDLSSDYRMLEELSRNVESYKKALPYRFLHANKELPHHLYKLRRQALFYKTNIKFMPPSFEKRKLNTTFLHFKQNIIFWHIEWIFVNADNLKIASTKVPETEKLCSAFCKYAIKQEDATIQERLQYYQARDIGGIRVFLKAEECAGTKYIELDFSDTLQENFKNKTIIEFPTLCVVLNEHAGIFTEGESGNAVPNQSTSIVNNIIKREENEDNLNSSFKNLLFTSECSDEESSEEGHGGL